MRKIFDETMSKSFPSDERHNITDSSSSVKLKQDKHKEQWCLAIYSQTAENPKIIKKSWKHPAKKDILHTEEKWFRCWLLIKHYGGQKKVKENLKMLKINKLSIQNFIYMVNISILNKGVYGSEWEDFGTSCQERCNSSNNF